MNIIHIDPSFIVINKPSGLLSVPGRTPELQDCVVNRIKQKFPNIINQPSVHRLDMDTSGLMVLACTKESHRMLSQQFADRKVIKQYIALLEGTIKENSGEIELAFRLDPNNRPHQIYDPINGKKGITRWRKLKSSNGITRVEFTPATGRTHQLRLHSAHKLGLNTPIVGDRLYGNGTKPGEMLLHACYLSFFHPKSQQKIEFTSKPPF